MKANKVLVKKIDVSELIDVLLIFEECGKKYVDLLCTINEKKDDLYIKKHKKNRKNRKVLNKLTPEILSSLLKNN